MPSTVERVSVRATVIEALSPTELYIYMVAKRLCTERGEIEIADIVDASGRSEHHVGACVRSLQAFGLLRRELPAPRLGSGSRGRRAYLISLVDTQEGGFMAMNADPVHMGR